jgi:chromosome segregation ATPase
MKLYNYRMSTEDKTTDPLLEILAKVRSIDTRLTGVENRLTGVETRLIDLENRLTSVENRLAAVENRMEALEVKVDDRLRETRPIWEQALKEIMDTRLDVRKLARKQDVLHEDNLEIRTDHKELMKRIDDLEHDSPTERLT